MAKKPCLIYTFLNAVQGNWRNAVYVECDNTACRRTCCGFLFALDRDGKAILLPADFIKKLTGETADKSECAAVLKRRQFDALASSWLAWLSDSEGNCPALRYIQGCCCHKSSCLYN